MAWIATPGSAPSDTSGVDPLRAAHYNPCMDIQAAARAERLRRSKRRASREALLERALADAARLVAAIADEHRPLRIWQWGSLVHPERFSEISGIDIAVEGLEGGERALSSIRDTADSLTSFHVDLVEIEELDPGRAELIRRFGRVAWERSPHG